MAKTGTNIKNYDKSPEMGEVDYVVEWQKPTEKNGYTWYRLYASGWIIQGCSNPINIPSSGTTIILPLTMLHPQYMVTLMPINYSGDGIGVSLTNRTVNSFTAKNKNYGSSATVPCLWKLEGYAE